jgi:hypothetical protein
MGGANGANGARLKRFFLYLIFFSKINRLRISIFTVLPQLPFQNFSHTCPVLAGLKANHGKGITIQSGHRSNWTNPT